MYGYSRRQKRTKAFIELKQCSVKDKVVPLQAWSGPEVSMKLRISYYMAKAQDGSKVVNLTHRPPLPPENAPGTRFC